MPHRLKRHLHAAIGALHCLHDLKRGDMPLSHLRVVGHHVDAAAANPIMQNLLLSTAETSRRYSLSSPSPASPSPPPPPPFFGGAGGGADGGASVRHICTSHDEAVLSECGAITRSASA
eukprot:CAMPEP_0119362058 /NCGR_PEP_ID=MMETSP1334-20130426/9233_1 /TAXON_ID=127549 /ORGANISM="Calcidiscus leptoporus, Strain RCC1130" /LENGTH=118 /DNA_ID=CAMNT_0007377221 /DNA_START=690 /DNA_END=1047 /DNA_ORIENTATION=-